MFKELSEHWDDFKHYPPGERFERYYRSRHHTQRSLGKKALLISAGILIMATGVIFLAIPGPGLLVMLVGAALIARESLYVSRLFDRFEPRLWQLTKWCEAKWRNLSPGGKILLILATAILGLLALYITYKIFSR
ncbi:MAG TPA: PGPGW domain-containing protein [Gammaproteobacteria bacterium]|nr:PGPGW domain-containing protein [Gammaproteobacteria bacterium]